MSPQRGSPLNAPQTSVRRSQTSSAHHRIVFWACGQANATAAPAHPAAWFFQLAQMGSDAERLARRFASCRLRKTPCHNPRLQSREGHGPRPGARLRMSHVSCLPVVCPEAAPVFTRLGDGLLVNPGLGGFPSSPRSPDWRAPLAHPLPAPHRSNSAIRLDVSQRLPPIFWTSE
jgi:hypothetical protein